VSTLSAFFKGSDTKFGLFYPNHYIVAVFRDLSRAERAAFALRNMGVSGEDVVAVPGEDVLQLSQEEQRQHPVWSTLMKELSLLIGTEEAYSQHDRELAARGAGFVAVYCPSEVRKKQAWALLKPMEPMIARYYALSGIEHLTGEF
jgi:hypothetical protein